jgi:DNA-binding NtrC family response regulator
VIQEREFMRLGARESTRCDVRIIATTNRVLKEEIRAGKFREDLFFRLNVIPLRLEPLRTRKEDIPLLVHHFLSLFCAENGKPLMRVSDAALQLLGAHDWPGNVRQLQNVVERAVILSADGELDTRHFELHDEMNHDAATPQLREDLTIREMEQELILRKLTRTGGNRTRAASELGISVRTLRNKLHLYQEHGVTIPG